MATYLRNIVATADVVHFDKYAVSRKSADTFDDDAVTRVHVRMCTQHSGTCAHPDVHNFRQLSGIPRCTPSFASFPEFREFPDVHNFRQLSPVSPDSGDSRPGGVPDQETPPRPGIPVQDQEFPSGTGFQGGVQTPPSFGVPPLNQRLINLPNREIR